MAFIIMYIWYRKFLGKIVKKCTKGYRLISIFTSEKQG